MASNSRDTWRDTLEPWEQRLAKRKAEITLVSIASAFQSLAPCQDHVNIVQQNPNLMKLKLDNRRTIEYISQPS